MKKSFKPVKKYLLFIKLLGTWESAICVRHVFILLITNKLKAIVRDF